MAFLHRGKDMKTSLAKFLLTMLMALPLVSFAASSSTLSTEAQAAITQKLAQISNKDLLVFNRNGSVVKTFGLNDYKLQHYGSLSDLLTSGETPVATCKRPVPTPPAGCVMCDDGHAVCTKGMKAVTR